MKTKKQKRCKICRKRMPFKKYNKWCYCDECKKSDEYKKIEKNGNFTALNKGKLVIKRCKICNKDAEMYLFSHPICNNCKKTQEYQEYIRQQRQGLINKPCVYCGKVLSVKKYRNNIVCDDCKVIHRDKLILKRKNYKKPNTDHDNDLVKRICKICKKEFIKKKRQNRLTCDDCKLYHKQNRIIKKKCKSCGNVFECRVIDKRLIKNCSNCRSKFSENNYTKIIKCKVCGKIVQIAKFSPNVCSNCQNPTNYYFTKPHRILKNIINSNFLNNNFETEQVVLCNNNKAFSVDEIDKSNKIVIFVDGDYWHANPIYYKPTDIVAGKMASYIRSKDKYITKVIESNNYLVLRFWEHTIKRNPQSCILFLKAAINNCKTLLKIRKLQSSIKSVTVEQL